MNIKSAFNIICSILIPVLLAIGLWDYSIILALIVALSWALFIDDTIRHFIIFWRTGSQRNSAEKIALSTKYTKAPLQNVPRFAIFLRGFARENTFIREEANEGWLLLHYSNPVTGRYLEKVIVRICKPYMDVVGLTNVFAEKQLGGIIWLNPGDNEWQSEIKELIERALFVFLFINNWTPGIQHELNLLQTLPVSRKTVILISPEVKSQKYNIELALHSSEKKWAGILEVPDKNISWAIIFLIFGIGLIVYIFQFVNVSVIMVLLFAAYSAFNELRLLMFIHRLKQNFRNSVVV